MKKFLFGLSDVLLMAVGFFSVKAQVTSQSTYSEKGATCYTAEIYFCRYCNGGELNKKQVTRCTRQLEIGE